MPVISYAKNNPSSSKHKKVLPIFLKRINFIYLGYFLLNRTSGGYPICRRCTRVLRGCCPFRRFASFLISLVYKHLNFTYSGDLGWFGRGKMVPEFEAAAFSTPVGQVSQMFKTVHGWHMFFSIFSHLFQFIFTFFSSVLVEVCTICLSIIILYNRGENDSQSFKKISSDSFFTVNNTYSERQIFFLSFTSLEKWILLMDVNLRSVTIPPFVPPQT